MKNEAGPTPDPKDIERLQALRVKYVLDDLRTIADALQEDLDKGTWRYQSLDFGEYVDDWEEYYAHGQWNHRPRNPV